MQREIEIDQIGIAIIGRNHRRNRKRRSRNYGKDISRTDNSCS